MLPRLLAFALFCLVAPAALSAPPVPLKPFQATSSPAQAKTLAGTWKGTFIFERKDNAMKEEVSFLVEVAPDLSTLTMTALPPLSSDPDTRTSPVTDGPIPADWDGELLRAHTQRDFQDGKAQVQIIKTYILRPGRDRRHLGVSYEVVVKTLLPHDKHINTVLGTGELVRQ